MITWMLRLIFGTKSQRDIKKLMPVVAKINTLENEMVGLSEDDLKAKARALKERVQAEMLPHYQTLCEMRRSSRHNFDKIKEAREQFQKQQKMILDAVLPEAFALVRETSKRILKMRHYDVQLMGGIVLHQGKIAEMTTGEGKTLMATLPVFLNALSGLGVHVVTVNDYLAQRDRQWMGPIYEFLGMSVGVIVHDMNPEARKQAYSCDITYGTNNEFGFDYLRDNMVVSLQDQVQRPLNYCIVDEVDSILIDEARTPLIISGAVDTVSHCYDEVKSIVRDVVNKQTVLIENFIKEFDKAFAKNDDAKRDDDSVARWLYLLHRGAPKDAALLARIAQHPELKRKLEEAITLYGSKDMSKDRVALEAKLYYIFDEKSREATLTGLGEELLAKDFPGQFELDNITDVISAIQGRADLSLEDKSVQEHEAYQHYENKGRRIRSFEQLLKAYVLFQRDVDYVVQDNKVVIVDEFTGRMMPGRRFSEGLHEALEAKENVKIQRESQTLATITFQNYFRMYHKLSGMTGTADTEASEFHEIYKLDVVVVPTNKTMKRLHNPDVIYKTSRERYDAVVKEIEALHYQKRPVLVGTVSIEKSEYISQLLSRKKILHEVLNAKNHAREAEIIALAGQPGAVTIATNMAGRGTDIVLGEGVAEKGGLHVIGTERHESRRIDNQLRGRAGRQGDPGSSRFFLSLEDDLMRIFGSDRIAKVMERLGMKEGEDIQHPLVTRAIETAQKRVEAHHFDIRKWLLKYDNVMNKQREVIYEYRQMILEEPDLLSHIYEVMEELIAQEIEAFYEQTTEEGEEDWGRLVRTLSTNYRLLLTESQLQEHAHKQEDLVAYIGQALREEMNKKVAQTNSEDVRRYVCFRLLESVDKYWKDHLYAMDELRESVGLRAYGQVDPLYEYQKEGHRLFSLMIDTIKSEAVSEIFRMPIIHVSDHVMEALKMGENEMVQVHPEFKEPEMPVATGPVDEPAVHDQSISGGDKAVYQPSYRAQDAKKPFVRNDDKKGRNDICSCGSGKKYKKCCGR